MPLKTAVGITTNDERALWGGRVDAVKAKTKSYIVLAPGDTQGKELLKQILKSLMLKATQVAKGKKQEKPQLNKSESLSPTLKAPYH